MYRISRLELLCKLSIVLYIHCYIMEYTQSVPGHKSEWLKTMRSYKRSPTVPHKLHAVILMDCNVLLSTNILLTKIKNYWIVMPCKVTKITILYPH